MTRDQSDCLSLDTKTEEVNSDWSPLRLSSYNLEVGGGGKAPPPPPVRKTETLERQVARPGPALTTFTSGRNSAEPLGSCRVNLRAERDLQSTATTPLPASLSELDLRSVSITLKDRTRTGSSKSQPL